MERRYVKRLKREGCYAWRIPSSGGSVLPDVVGICPKTKKVIAAQIKSTQSYGKVRIPEKQVKILFDFLKPWEKAGLKGEARAVCWFAPESRWVEKKIEKIQAIVFEFRRPKL